MLSVQRPHKTGQTSRKYYVHSFVIASSAHSSRTHSIPKNTNIYGVALEAIYLCAKWRTQDAHYKLLFIHLPSAQSFCRTLVVHYQHNNIHPLTKYPSEYWFYTKLHSLQHILTKSAVEPFWFKQADLPRLYRGVHPVFHKYRNN